MNTALEISMYPLQDDYKTIISWFIDLLDQHPQIQRKTNGMSTQLQGEHQQLMQLLSDATAQAYAQFGRAVFVCKIIPGGVELDYAC